MTGSRKSGSVKTKTTTRTTRTTRRYVSHHHQYRWPGLLFNIWVLLMLLTSSACLGVLANFVVIQKRLERGIPWYFPFFITVAALTLIFIFVLIWLTWKRRLLPAIVMIGAFVLFILWIIGLVRISMALWGPGKVNSQCSIHVFSQSPKGESIDTLAWMMQRSICQSWHALFSFLLIGTASLVWIMVMAYQVFAESAAISAAAADSEESTHYATTPGNAPDTPNHRDLPPLTPTSAANPRPRPHPR
ncbi:uncharacterized protein BROUX77_005727 [Berkeleyomyces rouxiae]|uniref:uncharacterized protein n=1 Tax=Berkeleyomyces rouxiae TaxID=2035830 RepID=UPI003B766407